MSDTEGKADISNMISELQFAAGMDLFGPDPLNDSDDLRAFLLVMEERVKQEALWGEQNHPLHHPSLTAEYQSPPSAKLMARIHYQLPSADEVKEITNARAKSGKLSWLDILTEEHCEFAEAVDEGPEAILNELVQTAAVALAAIASELRRRRKEGAAVVDG